MAVIYELKERRVIPNWRDYKRTLQLGELINSNNSVQKLSININRSIADWKNHENIGTAADLINSSFISGINNSDVQNAINYIKQNEQKSSPSLLELVGMIEIEAKSSNKIVNNSLLEKNVDSVEEFQYFINNKAFDKVIGKTKKRAKEELKNPIVWVELARLYSMRGLEKKAEKAILIALHLAPNNRFVLRSATRFFIHNENYEGAIYYLKRSENIKNDPWLISAHIATSSIMGRFSPLIKKGQSLISSEEFSNFELTELASSLGTLEFKDGSYKKAKRFFEKSLLAPNDNSLAQLEWVSRDDGRFKFNPLLFENVINPFEARALEFLHRGNWNLAFENTIKWFLDVPFSKRPVVMGSYIAGSLLKDKNAAKILCEVGLQANPNDPTLLNNMVYTIATSEDLVMLDNYLQKMLEVNPKDLPVERQITYKATLGLASIRKSEIEIGVKLYKNAILQARETKKEYLRKVATINFANILTEIDHPDKHEYAQLVREINPTIEEKELAFFKREFENKLKANNQ